MSIELNDRLSALLPPPRDDEPASLRHDIVDELADHLTCAYHRELLRGTEPAAAKTRTLQRFGDPAAVARRLWLDAMKGTIMWQRILIGTCLVAMVASLQIVNLISQRYSSSATELALANRRVIEYLEQSRATNQEMMRHLQSMDYSAQSRQAMESCNVAFRLKLEMPDGPPASGFDVRLGRGSGGSNRADAQSGTSDERGEVNFEVGMHGEWEFTISRVCADATGTAQGIAPTPTGGMMASMGGTRGEVTWKTLGTVRLVAGGSAVKYIICPKLPPETSPVTVRVDWPADLADQNLCVAAQFVHTGLNLDTMSPWKVENPSRPNLYQTRDILYGPGPRLSEFDGQDQLYLWRIVDGKPPASTPGSGGIPTRNPVFADLRAETDRSGANALEFEMGGYRLTRLIVLRPHPPANERPNGERFDMLNHAEAVYRFALPVHQCQASPDEPGAIESDTDTKIGRVLLPPTYWREAEPFGEEVRRPFEVKAGTVNLWTIPLPEELAKSIRERLNLKQPAKAK